jgi:flagellar basal body P-ring protein FlgI
MKHLSILLLVSVLVSAPGYGEDAVRKALIRDITSIEGVRDNPVIGYGVVVGLRNTGDKQQTIFTTQMLGNILQHMGVQIPSGTVIVKNVAGVFVTANLPPFASPGTQLDVTVSSAGDARSLEGGLLLLTPLYGAEGQAPVLVPHEAWANVQQNSSSLPQKSPIHAERVPKKSLGVRVRPSLFLQRLAHFPSQRLE